MYRFLPLLLLLLSPMLPASVDDPVLRARQAEALLKQSPENPQALFQAAVALQQLQHLDRAEGYYRRLIELQPKWPEPRNNLAIILLKKGDYDGAIDLLISCCRPIRPMKPPGATSATSTRGWPAKPIAAPCPKTRTRAACSTASACNR